MGEQPPAVHIWGSRKLQLLVCVHADQSSVNTHTWTEEGFVNCEPGLYGEQLCHFPVHSGLWHGLAHVNSPYSLRISLTQGSSTPYNPPFFLCVYICGICTCIIHVIHAYL